MSAFSRFEQFMQNMVEGSVARLFRSPVQPAEIARRLERAMESAQTISVQRVIVPNVYRAFLHPQDFATFKPIRDDLEREMAVYLAELAAERDFTMLEAPRVTLAEDPGVAPRNIQVVAEMVAATPPPAQSTRMITKSRRRSATGHLGQSRSSRAHLILNTPEGAHTIPLTSTLLTIGRGLDNDVIFEDTRVSRRHAQLRYRARRFWITDLGSTNGTFVNGEAVTETALNPDDLISLGGLELRYQEG